MAAPHRRGLHTPRPAWPSRRRRLFPNRVLRARIAAQNGLPTKKMGRALRRAACAGEHAHLHGHAMRGGTGLAVGDRFGQSEDIGRGDLGHDLFVAGAHDPAVTEDVAQAQHLVRTCCGVPRQSRSWVSMPPTKTRCLPNRYHPVAGLGAQHLRLTTPGTHLCLHIRPPTGAEPGFVLHFHHRPRTGMWSARMQEIIHLHRRGLDHHDVQATLAASAALLGLLGSLAVDAASDQNTVANAKLEHLVAVLEATWREDLAACTLAERAGLTQVVASRLMRKHLHLTLAGWSTVAARRGGRASARHHHPAGGRDWTPRRPSQCAALQQSGAPLHRPEFRSSSAMMRERWPH